MMPLLAQHLLEQKILASDVVEAALQRQVIYGGTLDTILLEMELIDESRLIRALGDAHAMSTTADLPQQRKLQDSGVLGWFPYELCRQYRALPVTLADSTLQALVCEPIERDRLAELEKRLKVTLRTSVVPEHRFFHAVDLVYDVDVPARLSRLTALLQKRRAVQAPVPEPVARTKTAVGVGVGMVPEPPPVKDGTTSRLRPQGVNTPSALNPEVTVLRSDYFLSHPNTPLPVDEAQRQLREAEERDLILAGLCRGARSLVDFVAILMVHGDVAVGRLALGDDWLSPDQVATVSIPLHRASPFRAAVKGRAPYLGRVGDDADTGRSLELLGKKPPLGAIVFPLVLADRTVAIIYGDSGGPVPNPAIVGRLSTLVATATLSFQRIIANHRKYMTPERKRARAGKSGANAANLTQKGITSAQVTPVPARATATTARGHATRDGMVTPVPSATPAPPPRRTPVGAATPTPPSRQQTPAPTTTTKPSARRTKTPAAIKPAESLSERITQAEELIRRVLGQNEGTEQAVTDLLSLGEAAAAAIVSYLPGPLLIDRNHLRGAIPPLADHGPLLALLANLGRDALRPVSAKLHDSSLPSDARFYLTLAASELHVPQVIPGLAKRMFDVDPAVRRAAQEGLHNMGPSMQFDEMLDFMRAEIVSPETQRALYAAEAAGVLRDTKSVPRLIALLDHSSAEVAAAAHFSLSQISRQDFGNSQRRWRAWWDRARRAAAIPPGRPSKNWRSWLKGS